MSSLDDTPLRIVAEQIIETPERQRLTMTDDVVDDDQQQRITDRVNGILVTRGPIERTKGMLMVVYGVDEHQAFDILRAAARKTNSKLSAFAEQFRLDVAQLDYQESIPAQHVFDQLLRTTHERMRLDTDGTTSDLTEP